VPAFDSLRRVCSDAVTDGVTPGLVVVVATEGRNVFCSAFGHRQTEPQLLPATTETVYDLASLTKPLVTGLLAMRAVADGRLLLDEPLRPARPSTTVGLTLCHAGGFAAHRRFFERVPEAAPDRRAQIVALAAAEPLEYLAGARAIYSDLGFILLGDRLEQLGGARLDAQAHALFTALRLSSLRFADPALPPPFPGRELAATQRCPVRGRVLVGEVDDLNAWAMDGVAGHAGLFGDAADVAALAHALCAAWRDAAPAGGPPIVPAPVLRAFWTGQGIFGSQWRLAWDGPSPAGSLAGDLISRQAVGHLGFTGCSLWIDPARETFVLVLANRVHPTPRDDARFRALRPAINDAALAGLGYRAD
jgi:CubicO group peptidase (beta-lactamase class C family)